MRPRQQREVEGRSFGSASNAKVAKVKRKGVIGGAKVVSKRLRRAGLRARERVQTTPRWWGDRERRRGRAARGRACAVCPFETRLRHRGYGQVGEVTQY